MVLGIEDDIEEGTDDLRRNAVMAYMELLEKPNLPDCLLQLISWVLGEYIVFVEEDFVENVISKLIKFLSMLCKGNCLTKKPSGEAYVGINNRRSRAIRMTSSKSF